MFKNIQFNKIILLFFLIGIMIIGVLGIFFLSSLNNLNTQLEMGQVVNLQEIQNKTIFLLGTVAIVFSLIEISIFILLLVV